MTILHNCTSGMKIDEMNVWLKTFGMETDEMSIWLQHMLNRNEWNVFLGEIPFWMEINTNGCLDENQFEMFPVYIIRTKIYTIESHLHLLHNCIIPLKHIYFFLFLFHGHEMHFQVWLLIMVNAIWASFQVGLDFSKLRHTWSASNSNYIVLYWVKMVENGCYCACLFRCPFCRNAHFENGLNPFISNTNLFRVNLTSTTQFFS